MYIVFAQRLQRDWPKKIIGSTALLLAVSATSCKEPGYRTDVYPGQQGQYSVQRVPEAPRPAESSAVAYAPGAAPAPVAAATAPVDENLSQFEAIWPKLSDSDKTLLLDTARHLATQR